MKVYLVRHGESDANTKGLFSGVTDTPLTEDGKNQAIGVGLRLSDEKFDAVYSSPLVRAYDTAEIIGRYHKPKVEIINDLIEINFGICEGLSYVQIQEMYPEMTKEWQANPVCFKFPDGESLDDLFNRIKVTYKKIIQDFSGEKLLIVAHSGVIRCILSNEISETFDHYWKYRVENCKVSIIEYSDGYKILNALNT